MTCILHVISKWAFDADLSPVIYMDTKMKNQEDIFRQSKKISIMR